MNEQIINTPRYEELVAEVLNFHKQGDFLQMQKVAKNIIKEFPEFTFGYKALGVAYSSFGDYQKAVEQLLKAEKIDPKDNENIANLGVGFFNLAHNYQSSNKSSNKNSNKNSNADLFAKIEHYKKAKSYLLKALQQNPQNQNFINYIEQINNILGEKNDFSYLQKTEAIITNINNYNLPTIQKLFSERNYNLAEELIKKYFQINNININLSNIENINFAKKNIQKLVEILQIYTLLGDVYNVQGQMILANQNYQIAFTILQKIFAENKDNIEHSLQFATCYKYAQSLASIGEADKGRIVANIMQSSIVDFENEVEVNYFRTMRMWIDPYCVNNNLQTMESFIQWAKSTFENKVKSDEIYQHKDKNKFDNFDKNTLKIGFVSADLNDHVVSIFLKKLLFSLNNIQNKNITNNDYKLEFYAYHNSTIEDEVSRQLKSHMKQWRNIVNLSDKNAAELIYNDNINILFDLSGHTAGNRLQMFLYQPAPIQCTWFGWITSSAIPTMNYILLDNISIPNKQSEKQYCEKIFYMPEVWDVFTPPNTAPEINELPALQNGYITFGSFHNVNKVSPATLDLWALVLNNIPQAKFIYIRPQLKDFLLVQKLVSEFKKRNVQNINERIKFISNMRRDEYLLNHHKVDIILDTFPICGVTTTCESLYMGVPTITLLGELAFSRFSASFLNAAGLQKFICKSKKEVLKVAKYFADRKNFAELNALRLNLRQQILDSPLCDADRFAKNFAEAMQKIWQDFLNE